jgi:hypothetical protein
LASSSTRKEHVARGIARRDGVDEGLICVLTCVEPCWSYQIYRNRETRRLELHGRPSKCLHYYHYWIDPTLGFMHARLQTWFPFTVHVCINGREWLARQMDRAGIGYVRRDNCFLQIANVARAQRLMDEQLRVNFRKMLDRLVPRFNPAHRRVFHMCPMSYYWSVEESEWASDVMFRRPGLLADLYPRLIRHVMENLGSREVMRFLGRKVPSQGGVNGRFAGEVVSDLRERPEGIRVKHRVNRNSIKMYDKEGSILRLETTINDAADLKVFRPKEGDGRGKREWRPMRKGVADLHRRAVVSQSANERYLDSLAAVGETTKFGSLVQKLCQPVRWKGKRLRALNPFSADDARLLETVNRGEFSVNGFRNRDLRILLYTATPADPAEQRLGCGPGFYSHRLAMLGHHCRGIDFGPASIEYAQQHGPDESRCEFVLGDIRQVAFEGPYDLAMILYGELNVFSPAEASAILRKVKASLTSQGRLIIEMHTPEAVERMGRMEPSEQQSESGLFSDRPHRCRTENLWLPEQKVAIQTFSVTEAIGGQTRVYRSTTKAWTDGDLIELLMDAGFHEVARCDEWPYNIDALALWGATSS